MSPGGAVSPRASTVITAAADAATRSCGGIPGRRGRRLKTGTGPNSWHTMVVSAIDLSAIDSAEPCVLLKLGEIVLKGRNRQRFERMLHDNIRAALRDVGVHVDVWRREGVIMLRVHASEAGAGQPARPDVADPVEADPVEAVARRVCSVMGIVRVHRAVRVRKDPEAAAAAAVALTAGATGTFGVRARRRDKRFPMRSTELAAHIGARIQQAHGLKVNLSHPDNPVFVEVDTQEVFVFTGGMPGQGGLPATVDHDCF